MNPSTPETPPRPAPRINLPSVLTSFVGRERERRELARALRGARLVTVTGTGGCGKTRLALRVAADLAAQFPDGVFWVTLARLDDPALVPGAVAAAVAGAVGAGLGGEAVCADPPGVVLDLLTSLVNKSLLAAETLQPGEARYTLLESIRLYAREKLAEAGEAAEARAALSALRGDG